MPPPLKKRFPWTPAATLAALVVLLLMVSIPVPTIKNPAPPRDNPPSLRLLRDANPRGDALREQMEAYDPTPLVLPTRWNTTSRPPERPRDAAFLEAMPPAWLFTENAARAPFPPTATPPASPEEALRLSFNRSFPLEMGRADPSAPLPKRLAFLRVINLRDGRETLAFNLPTTANQSAPTQKEWAPMELLGIVTSEGLASGPDVTQSSGADEVDDFFREHLAHEIRVGDKLPPGFYAFRLGP